MADARGTPDEPAGRPPGAAAAERIPGRPPRPRTAGEMLDMARAFLERKGAAESRLEAELLCAHALGLDRLGLFLRFDQPVEPHEVDSARDLLVRRGRREPVAYVIGKREFYGRDFRVGPEVLVPRPETELLVDLGREQLAGRRTPLVAELGCGSGCLAVTLALEVPGARVVTCDLSPAAVATARANAEALGAEIEVLEGDGPSLLERRLADEPRGVDLLVSNPPYVDPAARASLQPEVRDYEPGMALFAPEGDPDHWVRRLVGLADRLLAPDGALLVELGEDQGPRAVRLARAAGLEPTLHRDLDGHARVLDARRPR